MIGTIAMASVTTGTMSSRLVAALSGVTLDQLRRWRRSGIVSASALPPKPGYPSAYRWDEYRRARLAALLLAHGLKVHRLRTVLNQYCEVIPAYVDLPTTVAEQRAIVKQLDGVGQTAEHSPQGAAFDFVSEAPLDEERIASRIPDNLPDGASATVVHREFTSSWPLGQLHAYSDLIDVRPGVLGGSPTLKGRRLETAALSSLHAAGDSVGAIADAYGLSPTTVKRAIAFELALEQHATAAR